ncbi:MAG: MBL fold metallo-hydrolase [Vulcanimicrobiaceae bacterium]
MVNGAPAASRVLRVLAPNPSPMTLTGTNSYLIFAGARAIAIDPGPPIAAHVEALLAAAHARAATIAAIAVTHGHPDHAPAAAMLHARTQAPVYGHARATFPVDRVVGDGDRVDVTDAIGTLATLDVFDAPGHARDHLVFAFAAEAALFTGDVVVGEGTIVIAPPNGDMRDYQRTLERLRRDCADARTIYGGHGEPVSDPRAKLDAYIAHRERREAEILAELASGERTIARLVATIYATVSRALWPAAARQVLAYLIALEREGRIRSRILVRAPTTDESALLNPDLSRIVDPREAAVAAAELGFDRNLTTVAAYALV